MNNNFLTTKNFWSTNRGDVSLDISHAKPIVDWIEQNINLTDVKLQNCFEIGCYPGRFLTIFGKYGLELNGIDYSPGTSKIKKELQKSGYQVNKIVEGDFFEFTPYQKFDIVCSFGFIEHFKNWEQVFEKHLDLVKTGGYLIIEVPNYRGFFQRIPRFIFDNHNYRLHNIDAMQPKKWETITAKYNFETISIKYFGGYRIGMNKKYKYTLLSKSRRLLILFLSKIIKLIFGDSEHKSYSFFIGIICKKK